METFLDSIVSNIFDFFKTIAVKNAFVLIRRQFSKNFVNIKSQTYSNIDACLWRNNDKSAYLPKQF